MGLRQAIAGWFGGPAPALAATAGRPDGRKSAGLLGGAILMSGPAGEASGPKTYEALARIGYLGNPVVHRCVRLVGETAAAIPLLLYREGREVSDHPLLTLLERPHAGGERASLVETIAGHLLLSGNAFLEAVPEADTGGVRALYVLRPDRVRIVAGTDGWPEAYEYRVGSALRRLPAESESGRAAPILHLKLFHPLSDHGGLSPLNAAAAALDLHNAATRWNAALLKNSARPSGALVYQPADGSHLSPEQFERLKAELESGYAGATGAGRPMLLEGGLDWKAMALSPRDMDFMEARNGAARDIALAFGVPPMLLGIPGDLTYANYAEANRAFYRLTVLPTIRRLTAALGPWLAAHFDDPALRLDVDLDQVEALSAERDSLWSRIGGTDFLSAEEKREAVGYGRET